MTEDEVAEAMDYLHEIKLTDAEYEQMHYVLREIEAWLKLQLH